ncbi:AMP-binding protein [Streptomyces sp. SAS_272]|uniref:AMP-binding protein n=1 Tax=Streptomyces sp. SAS_272 TaxID=3412747 RepID=UPI00403C3DF5
MPSTLPHRHVPIGLPIAGTELMVVDEDGHTCAPGASGELLIAGTGLTPGYLGEPELTAAAFAERDGRRWYRSGDRVRRRADGVLWSQPVRRRTDRPLSAPAARSRWPAAPRAPSNTPHPSAPAASHWRA